MRVVADHVQVIAVLVVAEVAALDVVDLGLQRGLLGGVVGLHRHQLRVIGGVGGAGDRRTDALRHHGAGGHGVEQQADQQENRQHDAKALFVAHHIGPGLLGFLLDRLGRLAGLLGGTGGAPAGLCGPFGGGVLFLDLLFLLPAGQWITGCRRVFIDGFLEQRLDVGLFQLPLGLGGLAVRFQFVAAVALPDQMHAGLYGFLGLVGALHAHVIVLGLADLLMELTRHRVARRVPHRMGQFGGRPGLILQHQLGRDLAGLGVHLGPLDLLFRDFCLRLIRFGGGLFRLADGLLQRRVRPFFLRKAQARFLNQTIPPA